MRKTHICMSQPHRQHLNIEMYLTTKIGILYSIKIGVKKQSFWITRPWNRR